MIWAGDFDRLRFRLEILYHWVSPLAVELRGLRRRLAAVDEEHLTGREGRLVGRQEDDRVCDLIGFADSLERHARHEAGFSFGAAGKAVEHRGLDRTRRDSVDP